jgi:phenylacetate-CoA ligase
MAMNDAPSFTQRIYEMLMESQYWPQEQMQEYQRSQLAQLLRHAKATVPFYKNRLDGVMRKDGKIDWQRWGEIPILKRADVAANFEALQSASLPPGHGPTKIVSTSGSTGLPIRIHFGHIMGRAGLANDWRAHRWWGFDWSAVLVHWHGQLQDDWESKATQNQGAWGCPGMAGAELGQTYVYDRDAPAENCINHLNACNAKYLYAQANISYVAASEMMKRGHAAKLDAVMSFGVNIEPEFREAVASAFGAKTRGLYSSKEAGRIGHTCPTANHYHVCAETVLVEILDDDDQPCAPGKVGRLIVTPFLGTPQPFVRYEQGDTGAWAEECGCGIRLPVITDIGGRIYHSFTRRNGTAYAPSVMDSLRPALGAEFWQFVQTKPNEIEVRYKPSAQRDYEKEKAFAHLLRRELKESYDVVFKITETLPLTASGKFIKYMNTMSE